MSCIEQNAFKAVYTKDKYCSSIVVSKSSISNSTESDKCVWASGPWPILKKKNFFNGLKIKLKW